jgi:transcriptional regulator of acetoin/glycerol metabolism
VSRGKDSRLEIHANLVATPGPESVSDPFVTRDLRQAKFATSKPSITFSEPEPRLDDSDEATLLTLSEQLIASVRQLARLTHLSRFTVYRSLVQHSAFTRTSPMGPSSSVGLSKVKTC